MWYRCFGLRQELGGRHSEREGDDPVAAGRVQLVRMNKYKRVNPYTWREQLGGHPSPAEGSGSDRNDRFK